MAEDTTIEALIERCVTAGLDVGRAHGEAQVIRAECAARHSMPTLEEAERLDELDSEVNRLSRIYITTQTELYRADPVGFHARMVEVRHRMRTRSN
jgi:hypothetical protein